MTWNPEDHDLEIAAKWADGVIKSLRRMFAVPLDLEPEGEPDYAVGDGTFRFPVATGRGYRTITLTPDQAYKGRTAVTAILFHQLQDLRR